MSFTMLSLALLLTVGAGVFLEALRGYRRGLVWTAISLSSVIFSGLVAAPLTVWLSDYPAGWIGKKVPELLGILDALFAQFPSLKALITAGVDAVISPFLFLILFSVLRGITGAVVNLLNRKWIRLRPDDPSDPIYESEHAPWYRRHGRLVGGCIGGLCGWVVALILLSPVVGFLSCTSTILDTTDSFKVKWSNYGLNEAQVESIRDTVNDPVSNVLEAMGGGVIFDSYANTRLNGRRAYLRHETEACSLMVTDMVSSMKLLQKVDRLTPEQRALLAGLGDRINQSEAAKMLAADTLNNVAGAWLDGRTFMKLACPSFGGQIDSLMQGALQVCAESTAHCVGRDISTLLDIYLIAADCGLLSDLTYDELAVILDEDGVINLIYNELLDNPCMAPLAGELTNVALRMMASALEFSDFNELKLDGLMKDLSDAMNLVNGMGTTNAERVESMKEYTKYYAEMYGMKLPDSLAEMAAVAFIDKLGDTGGKITSDQLYDLLEQYMPGK